MEQDNIDQANNKFSNDNSTSLNKKGLYKLVDDVSSEQHPVARDINEFEIENDTEESDNRSAFVIVSNTFLIIIVIIDSKSLSYKFNSSII